MEFISRYRKEIIISICLIFLYFLTRLLHIMSLPIFTDEAIYVRWAQIAKQDAAWRFISLTDGKPPMQTWAIMLLMHFIKDPLLAGRFASVLTGLGSMIGIFFLAKELFKNKWIGFLSSGIYLFLPFTLVYDRMALEDSMVCMFLIWGLYLEIVMVRKLQSYMPFVVGLVIGGGLLTKTTNLWSIYFMPFLLLVFDFKKPGLRERIIKLVAFAGLAALLAYLYYSILRLSPYFGIISEKNHTFYFPLKEWLQHPLTFFNGNLQGMTNWLVSYVNIFGLFLAVLSLFVMRKFWKEKLLLILWFVVPFFVFALIAKVLYPRYILYMTVFLIPLMAVGLYGSFRLLNKKIIGIIFALLLLGIYVYADCYILFDFIHAPIPSSDLNQFVNAWPAGGGVSQMVTFFRQQSQNQKIYVASEGTFGSVPTLSMEIYLDKDTNIEKRGIYPVPNTIPTNLLEKAKIMPVYMVFEQTQIPPSGWPLKLVVKYQKGIGSYFMSIYQVLPQK